MKCTVETVSPTRVRLAVEVPFDELKPSMDRAYKKIASQVRVPGFRPGRVPAAIIDQRIGRAAVLEEAVQEAVPQAYTDALRDADVRAVGQPEIELSKVDTDGGISFTAEVDVRPEFTVPALDGIAVTVPGVEVTEEEITERLASMRDRFAMLTSVERPIASGDYVTIDLAATVDGEEVESATGMSYEVGSDTLIDGIDEALIGASAGEERSFDSELVGGEYAGKTARVTVTPRTVKEKQLPELDDEFAQSASEFDTFAELREEIEGTTRRAKLFEQVVQARDKVLDALLEATPMPLPESVVVSEFDWRWESMTRRLESAGVTLEQFLATEEQTEEELRGELRSAAEKSVHAQLLLDALADREQVGVSDSDLAEHLVHQARQYGIEPEEFVKQMVASGNVRAVVAEIRRDKALLLATEAATITEEGSGATLDLAQLRKELEGPTAEQAATDDSGDAQDATADGGAAEDGATGAGDAATASTAPAATQ